MGAAAGTLAYESSWSAFARASNFLEQNALYNSINYNFTYSAADNATVSLTTLNFLYCPSDPGPHFDTAALGGTTFPNATTLWSRHSRNVVQPVAGFPAAMLA